MANAQLQRKIIGVPLSKGLTETEEGFILVRGKFTSDARDEVGDIITKAATEKALPKFRQWGNIRRMHAPDPVGRVTRIGLADGLAWNEVEIKVIDPKAVFEVKNGLLQALSVGILVSLDDVEMQEDGGWIINNYSLAEISLVDHPANYDARLIFNSLNAATRALVREKGLAVLSSLGINPEGDQKGMDEIIEKAAGEMMDECVSQKKEQIQQENPDMSEAECEDMARKQCEEGQSDKSLEPEVPAEQPVAEEIPAEQPAAAEEAPVEEQPAAEETPVEEQPVAEEEPVQSEEAAFFSAAELTASINSAFSTLAESIKSLQASVSAIAEQQKAIETKALPAAEQPQGDAATDVEAELRKEIDQLKAQIAELSTPAPQERKGQIPTEEPPAEVEPETQPTEKAAVGLREAVKRFAESKHK